MNTAGKLQPRTLNAQLSIDYLVSFPSGYEADPQNTAAGGHGWPLLLFLHGAGERGHNLEMLKRHGPPKQIAAGQQLPFVLVAPQCPSDSWWESGVLHALVVEMQQTHRIDLDRTYCTGISMGGFGTWDMLVRHPGLFAAAAPVCGGGDPFGARFHSYRRTKLAIWAFHGEDDPLVPVNRSREMVEAFRHNNNADVQLTVYPGVGHDSWTQTYDNPQLYQWLLEHRRND